MITDGGDTKAKELSELETILNTLRQLVSDSETTSKVLYEAVKRLKDESDEKEEPDIMAEPQMLRSGLVPEAGYLLGKLVNINFRNRNVLTRLSKIV